MRRTITFTITSNDLTDADVNTLVDDIATAISSITNAAEYESDGLADMVDDPTIDPPLGTWVATNAPAAYDYGWTTQVEEASLEFHGDFYPFRIVVVPHSHVQYQSDRYMSGMYVAFRGANRGEVIGAVAAF